MPYSIRRLSMAVLRQALRDSVGNRPRAKADARCFLRQSERVGPWCDLLGIDEQVFTQTMSEADNSDLREYLSMFIDILSGRPLRLGV